MQQWGAGTQKRDDRVEKLSLLSCERVAAGLPYNPPLQSSACRLLKVQLDLL